MADLESNLRAAVRRAYDVFPEMDWDGRPATVCPCCVSESVALELASSPRELIGPELIAEYLSSAHDTNEGVARAEFGHFLPRIFELIADGEDMGMTGAECALTRLSRREGAAIRYDPIWRPRQIDAIEGFFAALWARTLAEPPSIFQRLRSGEYLFDCEPAEEALIMVANAGGDPKHLLLLWDLDRSASADLHLAALVANAAPWPWREFPRKLEDRQLGNPHWESVEAAEAVVVDWLLDAEKYGRLLEAMLRVDKRSPEAETLGHAADELQRVMVRTGAGLTRRSVQ